MPVPGDRDPKAAPGVDKPDPVSNRKPRAQRVALDTPAREQPSAQHESAEDAGQLGRLHARRLEEPAGGRLGPTDDVAAEVQPVRLARLGHEPPADAGLGLQHDDIPIAQLPRGRKAGDAPADHDHLCAFRHHPFGMI